MKTALACLIYLGLVLPGAAEPVGTSSPAALEATATCEQVASDESDLPLPNDNVSDETTDINDSDNSAEDIGFACASRVSRDMLQLFVPDVGTIFFGAAVFIAKERCPTALFLLSLQKCPGARSPTAGKQS